MSGAPTRTVPAVRVNRAGADPRALRRSAGMGGAGGTRSIAGQFDQLRSDYQASKSSRFRRRRSGVPSMGAHADYHYRSDADYLRMMELARDFDRNDVVVGQGIDRLVDNVVPEEFRLDPETGDADLDALIAARWSDWSNDELRCDASGQMSVHDQARMALRHTVVDGDIFFPLLEDGSVQSVEAHRARTPSGTTRSVVHGVLLDDRRRPVEYWFTREDTDPRRALRLVRDVSRVPVWQDVDAGGFSATLRAVLHVYHPKRLSQSRGVTSMAAIPDMVSMHDDIQLAKLVQQQVVSCFAILRQFKDSDVEAPEGYGQDPGSAWGAQREETQTGTAGSTERLIDEIAPGIEYFGLPGEELSGFSPNVPNAEFFDQAKLVLGLIAVNLRIPLAVLLLDPSETNFSGWRGAMDQARMGFRTLQRMLIRRFYRPLYLWKLAQWLTVDAEIRVAAQRVMGERGGNVWRHKWVAPRWGYIEPLKDAQADEKRLASRLISPRRSAAERGMEWNALAGEIVEDNATLVEGALARARSINEAFPEAMLDWRELVGFNPNGRMSGRAPRPGGGGRGERGERGEREEEEQEEAADA